MTIDITPFDEIEVWGNPWHGKLTQDGALTLDNGMEKKGGRPPTYDNLSGTTFRDTLGAQLLVRLPGLPEPENKKCDDAIGASWKNWALLAGSNRQYDPFSARSFGPASWFYRTKDGTVWQFRIGINYGIQPAYVLGSRNGGASWITICDLPVDLIDARTDVNWAGSTLSIINNPIAAAGDGSACLLRRPMAGYTNWWKDGNTQFPEIYALLKTEGGSADDPPTVTAEIDPESTWAMRPAKRVLYTPGTFTLRAWDFICAWITSSGEIIRARIEYEETSNWVTGHYWAPGGGLWMPQEACSDAQATHTLVIGQRRIVVGSCRLVNQITTTPNAIDQSVSATTIIDESVFYDGSPYISEITRSFAPDGGAQSLGVASGSADGSVIKLAYGNSTRFVGMLGNELGPVDGINHFCSQHPLTGELALDTYFF